MCFGFSSDNNNNTTYQNKGTKKNSQALVKSKGAANNSNSGGANKIVINFTISFQILMKTFYYGNPEENERSIDLIYSDFFSTSTTPLLVFIHGGAWTSEDKTQYTDISLEFANIGYTCAAINYRLSTMQSGEVRPKIQHPEHINDVGVCIQMLHNYPLIQAYDPKKIYVVAHSSGAHIAMSVLLNSSYSRYIKGFLGVSGIYDIPLLLQKYPSYKPVIQQAFGEIDYKDASPTSKMSNSLGSKRVLLVHGYEDKMIDSSQSLTMYSHIKKFHNDVWFHPDIKGDHDEVMKYTLLSKYVSKLTKV